MVGSGVSSDPEALNIALEKTNIPGGDQEGVISAVNEHCKSFLSAEKVETMAKQLSEALPHLVMALGIKPAPAEDEQQHDPKLNLALNGTVERTPAVIIENVDTWKAGLQVSEGPRPVVDLSEFEEIEPKL